MIPLNVIAPLIVAFFSYYVVRSVYRLYFHPLSKIPGPKIAALGRYYEFYFNIIKGGGYLFEIERMHEKYGPIVRINHRELHIKDSHFYDEIYSSRKSDKEYNMTAAYGVTMSVLSTLDHEHHRFRRALLANFFSKKAVLNLESLVLAKVLQVLQRFEETFAENAVVSFDEMYSALAADVISEYAYGQSLGCLDSKELLNPFRDFAKSSLIMMQITTYIPSLIAIFRSLPEWLARAIQPAAAGIYGMKRVAHEQTVATLKITSLPDYKSPEGPERNIFHAMCDPSVPAEERTINRVEEEAFVLLGAATETTARVLTVGSFHLYQNKSILHKLREELKTVMPTPDSFISWTQLEKLPYMTAFVNESLRLSHPLILRHPRILRNESLIYKEHVIPPGTPVSQSPYFVHMDPTIFPEPEKFDPERWIRATEKGERLTKYIVIFTKGNRICLGINLAYAEIYLMFAAMARKFDMDLYETTYDDIRVEREIGGGLPKHRDVLHVRAKITDILAE